MMPSRKKTAESYVGNKTAAHYWLLEQCFSSKGGCATYHGATGGNRSIGAGIGSATADDDS